MLNVLKAISQQYIQIHFKYFGTNLLIVIYFSNETLSVLLGMVIETQHLQTCCLVLFHQDITSF